MILGKWKFELGFNNCFLKESDIEFGFYFIGYYKKKFCLEVGIDFVLVEGFFRFFIFLFWR